MQTTGLKVALRDPRDHKALFPGSRTVTLHDDCIFDGGPTGDDGGTFTADDGDDRQGWVDYVKQVASGNTFGGEGCDDATDAKFDWSAGNLCSSNGLKAYIDAFQISYLKVRVANELENEADDRRTPGLMVLSLCLGMRKRPLVLRVFRPRYANTAEA